MSEYGGGFLKTIRHPRSAVMSAGFALVVAAAPFDAALSVASIAQSQVEGYQYPSRTVRDTHPQPIIWNWAPVEVTPGTATITATTYAPTVTAPVALTPAAASLAITLYSPTVAAPVEVVPEALALTLTEYAPTVSTPSEVVPGSASLTLTWYAPTVSTPVEVVPGSATLTITEYAPDVSASTGFDPLYFQNVQGSRTPARKALRYRYPLLAGGFSTTGTGGNVNLEPGAASLSTTTYAPSVDVSSSDAYTTAKFQNIHSFRTPQKKRYDPRREHHKFSFGLLDARPIMPAIAQLSESYQTKARFRLLPLIQEQAGWRAPSSATVEPSTATLTLTTFAPTVTATGGQSVTPDTASLTLTTFAPTVTAPRNVTPASASLALTLYAPDVATPREVITGVASLTVSTFAPTISTTGNRNVIPGTAALVLSAYAPTVEGDFVISQSGQRPLLTRRRRV